MQLDLPSFERKDGELNTCVDVGYGDPHGTIWIDKGTRLKWMSEDDCDQLIKAAVTIKEGIRASRAKAAAPHGSERFHKGTCQLCGKPEGDEIHAAPAPVITDSDRTCDQANPHTGAWCHRGGDHGVHRDTNGDEWRTDVVRTAPCLQPEYHGAGLPGGKQDMPVLCDRPEHHEPVSGGVLFPAGCDPDAEPEATPAERLLLTVCGVNPDNPANVRELRTHEAECTLTDHTPCLAHLTGQDAEVTR